MRELTPRYFDITEFDTVWQRLFEDKGVSERVNAWLRKDSFKTKYQLKVNEYYSRTALERELPTFLRDEIARFLTSKLEYSYSYGASSYGYDFGERIMNLLEKYDHATIEKFLRSQPDLFKQALECEYSFITDIDDEYWQSQYQHPSATSVDQLSENEAKEFISGPKFNWETWVGQDCLMAGLPDAIELFQRWAIQQPILHEFIDQKTDPFAHTSSFLSSGSFAGRDVRREILLQDKNSKIEVSLQDVGVGISQVLPVILNAFGERNKLIAIEQPEIHIHPALQAELGDVFIESALGENQNTFMLETHSEHLILRILRRIRETTEGDMDDWPEELKKACPNGIRPEDVAVLYVEPGEDGARVVELPVTPDGDFSKPWPSGFFTERSKELY